MLLHWLAIARRILHNVAAGDHVHFLRREHFFQRRQILRIGDIDRNAVWENIDVELVSHRHVHDLAADEMRLRFFRPGKFVDSEIHLVASVADLAHDLLVRSGERIERSWQKCHLRPFDNVEGFVVHAPEADES